MVSSSTSFDPYHDLQLVQVQLVHRHGERTPIRSCLPSVISPLWPYCHVASTFHATYANFLNTTATNTSDEHTPSHPAHETWTPSHQKSPSLAEVADITLRSSTQPTLNPFLKNIQHVGPIRKQIEEEHSKSKVNEMSGLCFFGQLTDRGRETLFQFGQRLRQLYVQRLRFLPPTYDDRTTSNQMYFRSTDYPRTLESIQHLIGGMYPLSQRDPQAKPPVVHTRWADEETLFANSSCRRFEQLLHEFQESYKKQQSEHIHKLEDKYQRLLNEPTKPNLHALFDTFIAMEAHERPLPAGVHAPELLELEKHSMQLWFQVYNERLQASRLAIGRFLHEMLQGQHGMDQAVKGAKASSAYTKFAIYSGHDSTLAPLLGAFRIGDGRWPPFASHVTFELFSTPKEVRVPQDYYVRVKYNDRVMEVEHCLSASDKHHPKDRSLCTLEAFKEAARQAISEDYETECRV